MFISFISIFWCCSSCNKLEYYWVRARGCRQCGRRLGCNQPCNLWSLGRTSYDKNNKCQSRCYPAIPWWYNSQHWCLDQLFCLDSYIAWSCLSYTYARAGRWILHHRLQKSELDQKRSPWWRLPRSISLIYLLTPFREAVIKYYHFFFQRHAL